MASSSFFASSHKTIRIPSFLSPNKTLPPGPAASTTAAVPPTRDEQRRARINGSHETWSTVHALLPKGPQRLPSFARRVTATEDTTVGKPLNKHAETAAPVASTSSAVLVPQPPPPPTKPTLLGDDSKIAPVPKRRRPDFSRYAQRPSNGVGQVESVVRAQEVKNSSAKVGSPWTEVDVGPVTDIAAPFAQANKKRKAKTRDPDWREGSRVLESSRGVGEGQGAPRRSARLRQDK